MQEVQAHGWAKVEQRIRGRTPVSRIKQEQLSRVTQDDSMDGIGRVESGTETEQLPSVAQQSHNEYHIFGDCFARKNLARNDMVL